MAEAAVVVPDRLLLWGMSQGSAEAGIELQRRHAKSLYALAFGVLRDPHVADAVVTRVFDQAARTGHTLRAESGSVFRWLAGLTRAHAQYVAAAPPPRTSPHPGHGARS